ncbi:hypothetical protein MP228_006770 [Amoeboaphelidium protococcarum]|nr:hypothetical protein MP228_006770 [Amoeboaphelidium protococcarum]
MDRIIDIKLRLYGSQMCTVFTSLQNVPSVSDDYVGCMRVALYLYCPDLAKVKLVQVPLLRSILDSREQKCAADIQVSGQTIVVFLVNSFAVPEDIINAEDHNLRVVLNKKHLLDSSVSSSQYALNGKVGALMIGRIQPQPSSYHIKCFGDSYLKLQSSLQSFPITSLFTYYDGVPSLCLIRTDADCPSEVVVNQQCGKSMKLASHCPSYVVDHLHQISAQRIWGCSLSSNSLAIPWLSGFLRGSRYEHFQGLYSVTPFNQHKIPLVFVHGFLSNVSIWDKLMFYVAQSGLDSSFQILYWQMPTNCPLLFEALAFKRALSQLASVYDQDSYRKHYQKMVLVGMSYGGLLCRLVLTDFAKGPQSQLSPFLIGYSYEQHLQNLFQTPPIAAAAAIFIATPHHGASGSRLLTRYLTNAILLPRSVELSIQSWLSGNNIETADKIPLRKYSELTGSFDTHSDLMKFISGTEIASNVRCFSFIGDATNTNLCRQLLFTLPRSARIGIHDGVVTLQSASLGLRAEAEYIIPATHMGIQHNIKLINQFISILALLSEQYNK